MGFPARVAQHAVNRLMGGNVVVRRGGASWNVRGVFDAASRVRLTSADGPAFVDAAPRITFSAADVADIDLAENDEVSVDGADYVIAEPPRPDGLASVVAILREAA